VWTKRLSSNPNFTFIKKDVCEIDIHDFPHDSIQAVIHLAGNLIVSDSVTNPLSFYKNNLNGLLSMIGLFYPTTYSLSSNSVCIKPHFIFSSSAAVYGSKSTSNPNIVRHCFYEEDATFPINSYGRSKLWGEQILQDCTTYGLKSIALRYFNVAGAGKNHGYFAKKATHAVPVLLNALKNNEEFTIFGNDYPTKDGTCIRDYLHVKDVARAHVLALERLEKTDLEYDVFNLGSGVGTSMIDLIGITEEILGMDIKYKFENRRPGDQAILVAIADKAKEELNWHPTYTMNDIIEDSWGWINSDDWR
jgi:UDP-glucose 4-epimerase